MKRVAAVISICAFLIAACAVKTKDTPTAATTANGASWTGQMRSMAASLQKLLPYVFSRQEFQESSNRKSIQKLIKEFAESVEHVPEHVGEVLLGKDPIVRYSISRLEANTRNAKRAFDEGHLEFARGVLRENMGLCFSCHTTTQFGPENNFSTKALPSS